MAIKKNFCFIKSVEQISVGLNMNIIDGYAKNGLTGGTVSSGGNKSQQKTTKTSIFYINDLHGQLPKMSRLVSASEHAGLVADKYGMDLLRLSAGDTFIGSNEKRNKAASDFLNIANIDAQALGNHEFDITASICSNLLNNSKTKILAMNLNFPENSNLSKNVMRSTTVKGKNGEVYGLIGIQPPDLAIRIKKKDILEGITVDDNKQTMVELQQEVEQLKKQGVNKIILLSHGGNTFEKEIAQNVSGIDVIIGGHSHDLIHDIKAGENLFYSPTGEPVIITQAGRDGNNFGILNLEFDENGVITKAQNNVINTNSYSPNVMMSKAIDKTVGISPDVGILGYSDAIPKNNLIEENPWADFVADAVKNELDAEVVLINSANFRGSVANGKITELDISSIFPFNNKLSKVCLNEEDLVAAIKKCAQSLNAKNSKPGLMQVGGLKYTIDSTGNLLELYQIDKNGNVNKIDVNNPNKDKYYTTIYDEFLVGGGDGLKMLIPKDGTIMEKYSFDKDNVTIDYIRKLAQPFEVRKDNRITILK